MTRDQRNTFIASFLGWTLDAFDYFLVIVVLSHIADSFNATIVQVSIAVTLTLVLRPVGALIFGRIADRYGRRIPLMIDVGIYSLIELLTAFSPNLTVFLVLRALYGIAMGGEWGLGAAMAMEALPPKRRGLFSGILQEGYAVGLLLAGLALEFLYVHVGWRGMFVIGVAPALLILYIRSNVPESAVWQAQQAQNASRPPAVRATLASTLRYAPLFVYAVLFMAAFNFMSHGSQDLYPTFLAKQHHFDPSHVGLVNTITAVGAIAGGIFFGWLSQRFGRRNSILVCAVLGLAIVPLWAHGQTIGLLALGGFLMQFMVQGAWGIIPAHLNEISPAAARGTFPGFTYQIGNLIASGTATIIAALAASRALPGGGADYGSAMGSFILIVFVAVIVMTAIGYFVTPEHRETNFAELSPE
ncbi:MAG TPA: MFS transporter [Candidatus Baltobacteraceae bacterium]